MLSLILFFVDQFFVYPIFFMFKLVTVQQIPKIFNLEVLYNKKKTARPIMFARTLSLILVKKAMIRFLKL